MGDAVEGKSDILAVLLGALKCRKIFYDNIWSGVLLKLGHIFNLFGFSMQYCKFPCYIVSISEASLPPTGPAPPVPPKAPGQGKLIFLYFKLRLIVFAPSLYHLIRCHHRYLLKTNPEFD